MEKLLNWSLAQSDPEAQQKAGKPDPELLAQLFGAAVDDATLMKQAIIIIENPEAELESKLIAWDNFELLIENLDNANNIENMKLWENIIEQLKSENEDFKNFASSIIGTAVQNNEKSQKAFIKYEKGVELLIGLIRDEVNLKAIYALSNVLRNNQESLKLFDQFNGWDILAVIVEQSKDNDKLKLRLLSLLNSLLSLSQTEEKEVLQKIQSNNTILKFLELNLNDSNLIDKSVFFLTNLLSNGYQFNAEETSKISEFIKKIETEHKDDVNPDDLQTLKTFEKLQLIKNRKK